MNKIPFTRDNCLATYKLSDRGLHTLELICK